MAARGGARDCEDVGAGGTDCGVGEKMLVDGLVKGGREGRRTDEHLGGGWCGLEWWGLGLGGGLVPSICTLTPIFIIIGKLNVASTPSNIENSNF